jgi:hypothetical protein
MIYFYVTFWLIFFRMVELLEEKKKRHMFWMRTTPLYPSFVNITKYLDLLAKDIGCLPPSIGSVWTWLSDPVLAWRLLVGALVPSQFSLRGEFPILDDIIIIFLDV